jgi:hypothetical protein
MVTHCSKLKCFATLNLSFRVAKSCLKDFDIAVHQMNQMQLQAQPAQVGYVYC